MFEKKLCTLDKSNPSYVHLLQCSSCIEWTDPIPTPLFVQRSDAQCCEISNIFREFFRQGQDNTTQKIMWCSYKLQNNPQNVS